VIHGQEELHVLLGKGEPARHHADDGVRLGVKVDFAANDGSVAAEAAVPKCPAENGGAVGGWLIVFGRKRASDEGLDTERRKQIPGTDRGANPLGQRAAVRQVVLRPILI